MDGGAPFVVAVGGFDPGGGAGLLRDWATASALGARATLVGTAWTEQSSRGVTGVEPRSAAAVHRALADTLLRAPGTRTSVKVGMVATPELADAIVAALELFAGPMVFDPVLAASSGGSLFAGDASALWPLVRRATLVTPNLAEAAALAERPEIATLDDARAAAHALRTRGAQAVLVKGGHLDGDATDVLVDAEGERVFPAPRIAGPSPRGTGCALATAIAIEMARGRGQALPDAIARAKAWLGDRIRAAKTAGDERHL